MRIAVPYENGEIAMRFGHTKAFKVYQVSDEGKLEWGREIRVANLDEHEEKANFLRATGVSKLICSGICKAGQNAVREVGIEIFGGVEGDADAAVDAYLAGALQFETDPDKLKCNHEEA